MIPDRMYLLNTIDNLEREKQLHDQKFKDNPKHRDCLPRFDTTIQKLKEELTKLNTNFMQPE